MIFFFWPFIFILFFVFCFGCFFIAYFSFLFTVHVFNFTFICCLQALFTCTRLSFWLFRVYTSCFFLLFRCLFLFSCKGNSEFCIIVISKLETSRVLNFNFVINLLVFVLKFISFVTSLCLD